MAGDVVLLLIAGMLAAWPFGDAWAGHRWLVVVFVGLLLGTLVALAGHLLRLGPWATAALLALGYLVFGPMLAVPDLAANGIGPNATAVRALWEGAVESWRDALTAPVPLGTAGAVLVVPLICSLLAGVGAGTFLWRSRWPGGAALVLSGLFVAAAAYGDVAAEHVLLRGFALAALLLVWLRMRAMRQVQARWGRRALLAGVVVALAGGVAFAATPALTADSQRQVLRDHVDPPFDPQDYPSPLSKFRKYVNSEAAKAEQLFAVRGLPKGSLVRLATMDFYDGIVWNVAGGADSASDSGTFRRLRSDAQASSQAQPVSITVLQQNYQDPWIPTIGDTDKVRILGRPGDAEEDLVYNRQTGTLASTSPVPAQTTFELDARITPQPTREQIEAAAVDGGVRTPAPAMVPDELTARVREWQGANDFPGGAAGSWLNFLSAAFKGKGFFSDGDGNVPAGHGYSRLALLTRLNTQPLGNDEQYAAAMALATQAMRQYPARVVVGFRTPDDSANAVVTVQGRDMAAWTEVKLDGLGWVAFDPTPPDQQILQRPREDPNDDPQPQVLQPPQPPGEPKEAGANLQTGEGGKKNPFDLWALVGDIVTVALKVGLGLLLTLPLWGILVYKAVRRRRRRKASDPTDRLSGGWRELTDRARDLGVRLPHSNTRQENGRLLADAFPEGGSVALAARADASVFGPAAPDDAEVAAYWADVRTAAKRMPRSASWWRRPWARLSWASVPWEQLRQRRKLRWQRRAAWVRGATARARSSMQRLRPTRAKKKVT